LPTTSGDDSKTPARYRQTIFPVRAAIAVIIPGWLRGYRLQVPPTSGCIQVW